LPQAVLRHWLRTRGIDWMPSSHQDVRVDLAGRLDPAGRWHGYFTVHVAGEALWRLGLPPTQPTSRVLAGPLPAWWHAAAERYWRRSHQQ
jgi:hypothetical protein